MSLLLILSPDDFNVAALWRDKAGEGENTPLADLAPRAEGQEVILALPGEEAFSRRMNLPMKSQRDLRRAASLAIEDQLARPMEEPALAFGPLVDGGRLVSAVPRAVVEGALDACHGAGFDPDIISVDHALLPQAEEGAGTGLAIGCRQAIRLPNGGFTAEADFVDTLLAAEGIEAISAMSFSDIVTDDIPNFRTGALSKRRQLPDLRRYAVAASILAVAGLVFLVGSFTQGLRYARAADEARNTAQANFQTAFPGTPILDMERQVQSRSGGAGQQSQFLPLAAILADVLRTQPTTSLASLTYSDDGELAAELIFTSLSDLEDVAAALSDRGAQVEEGSDVQREDGAFVTRLFLRAG